MSDELEERGISIRLLRDLERKDGLRQEITGWYTGDGSAGTFSERTQAALDDLEATLDELVKDSSE